MERCIPGREGGLSNQGAGPLRPLFSEVFWDDSGHVLNSVGGQGATKAWRTRFIQDPNGPLQMAWANTGNLLMQRRSEIRSIRNRTDCYRTTGLAKGKRPVGGCRVHFPPSNAQCAVTSPVHGKRQQQRARTRPQGSQIHYLRLWYLILGSSKMLA